MQQVEQTVLCADNDATGAIAMSTQVLCCAMYDQVKAMLNRPNQVGSSKGAINNAHGTHCTSNCADCIQVNHLDQWVGDCFHVDDIWLLRLDEIGHSGVVEIAQDDFNAHGQEEF